MKEVVYNHDNIKESDVEEIVIRVKAVIINSKNELMLGYCDNTYQFPGGHLEENETLEEGLIREVKEETGIDIKDYDLEPFEKITCYTNNYRNTGKTRTDESYDENKMNLDVFEKDNNYIIKMIPLSNVKDVLIKSIPDNPINKIIVEEMLTVLEEVGV